MEKRINEYLELAVKSGVNVKKGQPIVINSPVECAEYARILADKAYDAGAKIVYIRWNDQMSEKTTFLKADDDMFDYAEPWEKLMLEDLSEKGCGVISISASDPELFKDVDTGRVIRKNKVSGKSLKKYRERMMADVNRWNVISIPTAGWAKKVFPDLSEEKAIEKLWEAILNSARVEEGKTLDNWKEHEDNLTRRSAILNEFDFEHITIKNSHGTDLKIELPENHIWGGGCSFDMEGIRFAPNIPTEEIFTCPNKTGVYGIVKNTKPLVYNGNIIDDFTLWFERGKVIQVKADKNQELLEKLIATDETSGYLGEVALVPYDSPISQSNILFYNTLFDENASVHLALGKGYPTSVKGTKDKSEKELVEMGINDSQIHVDFMIGSKDTQVNGITRDGKTVAIFENGNFVF